MTERLPPPILPSEFELVDPEGFRRRFGGERGRDMGSETNHGESRNPAVIEAAREIAAGVCHHADQEQMRTLHSILDDVYEAGREEVRTQVSAGFAELANSLRGYAIATGALLDVPVVTDMEAAQ